MAINISALRKNQPGSGKEAGLRHRKQGIGKPECKKQLEEMAHKRKDGTLNGGGSDGYVE